MSLYVAESLESRLLLSHALHKAPAGLKRPKHPAITATLRHTKPTAAATKTTTDSQPVAAAAVGQVQQFVAAANLPAPIRSDPTDGTVQPTRPLFKWSAVTGASSYRILIGTDYNGLPTDPNATTGTSIAVNALPTTNSYTPSAGALSLGITYYWEVKARGTTVGDWSTKGYFYCQVVPASPTALQTLPMSDSIIISWDDNSSNEDGFRIERKIGSSGSWSYYDSVGKDVIAYNDRGVSGNTTYYYRVYAYNIAGPSGSYTNEASGVITPPASPTQLAAFASSDRVGLAWIDNSLNESGFKIERKLGSLGSWSLIDSTAANNATYTDYAVSPGNTYYYRVYAYNLSGASPFYTNEYNVTVPISLNAPSGLAATGASSTISLAWLDNSNNEGGFAIEWKAGATGTYQQIDTVAANVTLYTDSFGGLTTGVTYYYRVRAFYGTSYSGYSNEATASITGNLPAPLLTQPSNNGTGVSTLPTFKWSSVSNASSYRIMVGTSLAGLPRNADADTGTGLVINATPTSAQYTPSQELAPGTTYYWQVKGRSPSQYGDWSMQGSFTTAAPTQGDNAGNTPSSARNIGALSTNQQFSDAVSNADLNDYYKFTLSSTSPNWGYSLVLSGLSADADLQLLDAGEDVVWTGASAGTTQESDSRSLPAGTYYVRVYPGISGASTGYTLSLSAVGAAAADRAGNSRGSARDIGTLSTAQSFNDWVGGTDTNDYYKFSLDTSAATWNYNLGLSGLSENADVQLLDASGSVIWTGSTTGTSGESDARTLSAGAYFVRVYPAASANTNYKLSLSASAVSTGPAPQTVFDAVPGQFNNGVSAQIRDFITGFTKASWATIKQYLTDKFTYFSNTKAGIEFGVHATGDIGEGVTIQAAEIGWGINIAFDFGDDTWTISRRVQASLGGLSAVGDEYVTVPGDAYPTKPISVGLELSGLANIASLPGPISLKLNEGIEVGVSQELELGPQLTASIETQLSQQQFLSLVDEPTLTLGILDTFGYATSGWFEAAKDLFGHLTSFGLPWLSVLGLSDDPLGLVLHSPTGATIKVEKALHAGSIRQIDAGAGVSAGLGISAGVYAQVFQETDPVTSEIFRYTFGGSGGSASLQPLAAQPDDVGNTIVTASMLVANQTRSYQLDSADIDAFAFISDANQRHDFSITPGTANECIVLIKDGSGNVVRRVTVAGGGTTDVSFSAGEQGQYSLWIQGDVSTQTGGTYSMRWTPGAPDGSFTSATVNYGTSGGVSTVRRDTGFAGSLQEQVSSPTSLSETVTVSATKPMLGFSYEMTAVGDPGDELQVRVNGTTVWAIPIDAIQSDFVAAPLIDLSAFAGQSVNLQFALVTTGAANAAVRIDDIETQEQLSVGRRLGVSDDRGDPADRSATIPVTQTGTSSSPATFTITSSGDQPLNVTNLGLGGANAPDFTTMVTDDAGSTIAGTSFVIPAGHAYTIVVTFSPTVVGSRSATIGFNTNSQDAADTTVVLAVTGVASAPPPTLTSTQVQDGTAQRSTVSGLTLTFSNPVTFGTTSYTIQQSQDGLNWIDVSSGMTFSNPSNDGMAWAISSAAGGILDRTAAFASPKGMLVNGIYRVTLHGAAITSGGTPFNGGADQVVSFASNNVNAVNGFAQAFHVLFGDINGDGVVNGFDSGKFKQVFSGSVAYNSAFDFQGDGVVNGFDSGKFKQVFNVIDYIYN